MTPEEVSEVRDRIREINKMADVIPTDHSVVDLDKILNIRAFDLDKVMDVDPDFLLAKGNALRFLDSFHLQILPVFSFSCVFPVAFSERTDEDRHAHDHKEKKEKKEHKHDKEHHHKEKHGKGGKHVHDAEVSSVGIQVDGDLDMDKLNQWMGGLLRTKGADIYRMKGVLSVQGMPNRFVFQGSTRISLPIN